MSFERSIQAAIPKPARNRQWLATALLEAPDVNGQPGPWEAIEAVPGEVVDGAPTGNVADTVSTRHAQHDPGWYRLQWYDSGQNSKFSTPVLVGSAEAVPSGRWN